MASPQVLERTPSSLEDEKLHTSGSVSPEPIEDRRYSVFRSPFVQVNIVGACAFLSPGAGGGQSPFLANAANSIVFGLMVLTCLLGSSITDRIGYRWALCLGAVGYAPYADAGQILGGAITLGLNAQGSGVGSISSVTYYVFIALQAVAPVVALLLSNPHQVTRKSRQPLQMTNHIGFFAEMLMAQYTSPYINSWFSLYFTVRARALGAFVNACFGVLINFALGAFLDSNRLSKKIRARISFCFIMACLGGVWIWATVLQLEFIDDPPKLDWSDGTRFGRGLAMYLLFYSTYYGKSASFKLRHCMTSGLVKRSLLPIQNQLYWSLSQLARHPTELLRLSSFLRGMESAGSAVGYGISAAKQLPFTVPLGINFGLWGVAFSTALMTIWRIGTSINYDVKK
ncbi:hypothetical protein Rhopal_007524-T1 [Rhodotorula paludigena]|uniref:MFS general substrate transporter n=1 Tax=Rhodotorula paludigena TaxID=86838 RepID=A0AAV5GZ08_9BASI|nr:hypothetical protein Rhopal_007524-T1 [Rhodotorula paludigena]